MSDLKLTLYPPASYSFKNHRLLSIAAYAGLKMDVVEGFEVRTQGKEESFLKKFPLGKVPALETSEEFYLWETSAIAFYLASLAPNSGLLLPSDVQANAKIADWLAWNDLDLLSHLAAARALLVGDLPFVKTLYQYSLNAALAALPILDAHLATRTFLVGHRLTLADLTVAAALTDGFTLVFGPEERKKYKHVYRFQQTVTNDPKIAHIYKDVKLADNQPAYVAPKKEKEKEGGKENEKVKGKKHVA